MPTVRGPDGRRYDLQTEGGVQRLVPQGHDGDVLVLSPETGDWMPERPETSVGRAVEVQPWDPGAPTAAPVQAAGVPQQTVQPQPSMRDQILADFDRRVEEWDEFLPGTARDAGQFAEGLQRSIAGAVGAVPALTGTIANQFGADVDPYAYANAAKQGMEWLGQEAVELLGLDPWVRPTTETPRDRAMIGLGSGLGDALTFWGPAQATANRLARVARDTGQAAPGLSQRLAQGLASQPGAQIASGVAGGVAGETTQSPLIGMLTAAGTPFFPGVARRATTAPAMVDDLGDLPAERARLVQAADAEGIPLRPAQVTGSRWMETADSVLREHPLTAWLHRSMGTEQQQAFNRAIGRRSGTRADQMTPEVLEAAHQRLGAQYEEIGSTRSVALDDQFAAAVGRIRREQLRRLPTDQERRVLSYIEDFEAAADSGALSGRQFLDIHSELSAAARSARSDPQLQRALLDLREAADSAFTRTNPDIADDWRELNRMFANLAITEDAAAMSTAAGMVEGNITPNALRNAVRSGVGRRGFARGRGDLNDLTRVGGIVAQQTPNSGTAQRSMLTNWLTAPAATGTGALAVGADPTTAMLAAGAGVALPLLAHGAMHNRLTRGLVRSGLPSATATGGIPPELLAAVAAAQAENQISTQP